MEQSMGLLKPDCLKRGLQGKVLALVESQGLRIIAKKRVRLTRTDVDSLWPSCKEMEFYEDMVAFSLSGDCIVFLVEGDTAIQKLNQLVGHYDPERAKKGTVRQLFGTSSMENIMHSSLNQETYWEERTLFF